MRPRLEPRPTGGRSGDGAVANVAPFVDIIAALGAARLGAARLGAARLGARAMLGCRAANGLSVGC